MRLPPPARPPRLNLSIHGDVVADDGYCRELSEAAMRLLLLKEDSANRRIYFRRLDEFLNFEFVAGEHWTRILEEPLGTAVRRIIAYLEHLGCKVDGLNNTLDDSFDVTHDAMAYVRHAITTVRQFYRILCMMNLREGGSPAEINGWHTSELEDRLRWARARGFDPSYGLKNAGSRFIPRATESPFTALYDPHHAAADLTAAVLAIAPPVVRDLAKIFRINGFRTLDVLGASALGWHKGGLGDQVWCRNKASGDKLVKPATIPPDVLENMKERLRGRAHPHDPARNLLDYVTDLSKELASFPRNSSAARGVAAKLRAIVLFPRPGRDVAYTYGGYNYWVKAGVLEGDVLIPTSQGLKEPTSRDWRRAAISVDVKSVFKRTKDENERDDLLQAVARKHHHKSDLSRTYGAWEYAQEAHSERLRVDAERDADIAADRAGSPAPIARGRLASDRAQARLDALRARPDA